MTRRPHRAAFLDHDNRATAGIAYDGHAPRFTQREADADLVPKGESVGTLRTSAFDTAVDVDTRQHNIGIYLTDTVDVTRWLALTLGGRYQYVSITIRDHSDTNPAVEGDHTFRRFSPAAGLTLKALESLTLFASYSEGVRAPTPAELTCADENAPCKLPNAFLADPPLEPVVARTWELGARGTLPWGTGVSWSAALFRTNLDDDILFFVVRAGGSGIFQNVGSTRRQGAELGLSGAWRRLTYFASYAYVAATYESSETLASVTEADGVRVRPGDRIPGVPEHNLKLGAEVEVLERLWIGVEAIATSGSFLRGDDGNRRSAVDGYVSTTSRTPTMRRPARSTSTPSPRRSPSSASSRPGPPFPAGLVSACASEEGAERFDLSPRVIPSLRRARASAQAQAPPSRLTPCSRCTPVGCSRRFRTSGRATPHSRRT